MSEIILPIKGLCDFFGRDIEVPPPPKRLLSDLEKIRNMGVKNRKVYYLPDFTFTPQTELPGWKIKPCSWFWEQISKGKIPPKAAKLEAGWRIDLDPDGIPLSDDYLGTIMRKLRGSMNEAGSVRVQTMQRLDSLTRRQFLTELGNERKIYNFPGDGIVADDSRCGVSWREIEKEILPCFKEDLHIKGRVGYRRFIEYNVAGNMGLLQPGPSGQFFQDSFTIGDDELRLRGGRLFDGGLSYVNRPFSERGALVGFSIVISYGRR